MAILSISEVTTFRWTFEQDVERYGDMGISALGVWRQKLSDFGDEKGIELLRDSGMQVSSLMWAGGFTGSDGRTYRESLADAREAIQVAGRLRAGCLLVHSGGRAGHTRNHARRLLTNAVNELLPFAEEHGVPLALEPMHPGCAKDWTFLTELDQTLDVIGPFESPYVKLVLDTYQLGFQPELVERLPQLVPHLALVQLGDGRHPPAGEPNRCFLGDGQIPLETIVGSLTAEGYDGYYEVELIGEDVEFDDYESVLAEAQAAYLRLLPPLNV